MANVDSEGVARARRIENDNQHTGRGVTPWGTGGHGKQMGTKGTGRTKGNGTSGGGINRSTKPTVQN